MILDEKLFINESNSKRLTYNEFVDYLDSIDNGYHAFSKVSGEMGSGYRYVLSKKLTQEQKDYLAQYSNIQIGDAKYKYAPEIKYDTVILLNRMPKTSPVKEDYDKDFFYTYEAIRYGETDPHGKTVGTERTENGAEGLIDNLVVGKDIKENIGSDIAEYQKWVDYDMKKYGRISSLTNHKIRKAGLKIVKDKYGDYEVIANESIKEGYTPEQQKVFDTFYKDINFGFDSNRVTINKVTDNAVEFTLDGITSTYKMNNKVEESLSNKELDDMIEIAHKIGLNTLDDLQDFLKRQQQPSDVTIIDTLKRYSKEFDESKKYAKKTNEDIDFSNENYLLKPHWYSTTHGVTVGSIPKNVKIWTWFDGDNKSFFATSDIISTEDLKEYEIKEESPNAEDIPEHSRIQIQKYLEQPLTDNGTKISIKAQKVEEDLSADTNPVKPKDTGIAQLLIDAINGEWETIQLYNDITVNANNKKIAEIIKQINADEYTHVGLLQSALDLIAPNTNTNLEKGNEQADEIIDNKKEKNSTSLPESAHARVSVEDGEKLYDKYSTEMEKLQRN